MPANLTPDYLAAEQRFREAETPEEKMAALEEMLATIPKHKGTEKLQADIKRRMAKLRQEMQRRPALARRKPVYHVAREGAGQIVMIGPPNAGKSQVLASLTGATPEIADYPYTTRAPLPGMVRFENVQIQLVDMPPLAPQCTRPWMLGIIRGADGVLLVLDASSDDVLTHMEMSLGLLADAGLRLRASGEGDRDTRKGLVVANKMDVPGSYDRFELLREACGELPVLPVSARFGMNLEELKRRMFELLEVVRIYTKAPGKKPDFDAPFIVKRGTTTAEAAAIVHKELARNLKYTRVWGRGTFDGQSVPRDYVLHDGDIVEFHA